MSIVGCVRAGPARRIPSFGSSSADVVGCSTIVIVSGSDEAAILSSVDPARAVEFCLAINLYEIVSTCFRVGIYVDLDDVLVAGRCC